MNKDTLISRAQGLGFGLLGIAPASEFPTVPGWARSVIVLGMAALDPAFDLELYIEEKDNLHWSKWAYERLVAGAAQLALDLIHAGHQAEPPYLDLKAAAVRAGLGVWGLNNLVIARRYGPRLRFGAVFTDLFFLPDAPLLDYYCVSCSQCIAACPTGALSPAGFDRARCIAEFEPDAAMAERQKTMLKYPTPHSRLQCATCIDACPIGKKIPTRFWGLDGQSKGSPR